MSFLQKDAPPRGVCLCASTGDCRSEAGAGFERSDLMVMSHTRWTSSLTRSDKPGIRTSVSGPTYLGLLAFVSSNLSEVC